MALRVLEVTVPQAAAGELRELLGAESTPDSIAVWEESLAQELTLFRVLLDAEVTEPLMDALAQRFSHVDDFRIVVLGVEATVPHLEEKPPPPAATPPLRRVGRVSREELYSHLSDAAAPTPVYLALAALSSIVAAVGLLNNSVAAIIGAMVIAPLLGPNVALALATALADFKLAHRAVTSFTVGMIIAFLVAGIAGRVVGVDVHVPAIAQRVTVGWGDLILAVASGIAGVLAFTTGLSEALVGVMVAVALLPPWVTFGMLVGAGLYGTAVRALLLFLVNVISLNLAGVSVFLIQGVHPLSWWEEKRARRASVIAIFAWMTLVGALIFVIMRTHLGG